jgi:hypothetical protein
LQADVLRAAGAEELRDVVWADRSPQSGHTCVLSKVHAKRLTTERRVNEAFAAER